MTTSTSPARPNTSALRLAIKISTATSRIYRAEATRLLRRSRKARASGKTAVADKLLHRMFEMRWNADYETPGQRHRLSALAICRGKQIPCNPTLLNATEIAKWLGETGMSPEAASTAATNALKGITTPVPVAA